MKIKSREKKVNPVSVIVHCFLQSSLSPKRWPTKSAAPYANVHDPRPLCNTQPSNNTTK